MKSKAPLALMEQMIMILVFALAAALCLRAFVSADALSRQRELRDRALTEGQSMAELVKGHGGNLEEAAAVYGGRVEDGVWLCLFDEDWNLTQDAASARCRLEVVPQEGEPGLGAAQVRGVSLDRSTQLFSFPIAWQEEVNGLDG